VNQTIEPGSAAIVDHNEIVIDVNEVR